ncbi:hypothetical protein DXG01_014031, partial [Tephrocybe rancida]
MASVADPPPFDDEDTVMDDLYTIDNIDPVEPLPDPVLEPEPEPARDSTSGRPTCVRQKTWKLLELLPDPPAPVTLAPPATPPPEDDDKTPPPTIQEVIWDPVQTQLNIFGLYREYPSMPTHNPDDETSLTDLFNFAPPSHPVPETSRLAPDTSTSTISSLVGDGLAAPQSDHTPFKNSSIFGLMNWMWTGSAMKSLGEVTRLVNFLKSDKFHKEDIKGFDIKAETACFDNSVEDGRGDHSSQAPKDGWREQDVNTSVKSEAFIQVLTMQGRRIRDEGSGLYQPTLVPYGKSAMPDDIPIFEVPGLHLRKLIEVIKSAVRDGSAACYHYTPFKQFWQPHSGQERERIYDDMFSSDAFLGEHIKIQQQLPGEPGCMLECVVIGLMFWSDSTHLASFGNASLWPLYLYFSNQSKWLRGKPQMGARHHIAYIPKTTLK